MECNQGSRNNIKNKIDEKNIRCWFENEISELDSYLKEIYLMIFSEFENLCYSSKKALLLWEGCNRVSSIKGKQKYHNFPETIKKCSKEQNIKLDTRPNGPAIAAFEFAGGNRPARYGSNNKWHIHHIYSGKFPYFGKEKTLHATKEELHFTQSAGLVAVHPLIDALADESPAFSWFMRYKAYEKFGYDPDSAFSKNIDGYGFDLNKKVSLEILFNEESKN